MGSAATSTSSSRGCRASASTPMSRPSRGTGAVRGVRRRRPRPRGAGVGRPSRPPAGLGAVRAAALVAAASQPDVVHSPHYTMPLVSTIARRPKNVVTLHDATFFSRPRAAPAASRRGSSVAGPRCRHGCADALIAPSEATRDEVARHTHTDLHGSPSSRTASTTSGSGRPPRPRSPSCGSGSALARGAAVRRLPRHPRAAKERARAGPRLRPASRRARRRRRSLVLAGGKGWDDAIDPAVAEVPAHLRVLRPGFVPDGLRPRTARRRGGRRVPRATGRGSACRSSRRWPAAPPC